MEISLTLRRVLAFVLLLTAFWLLDGFNSPDALPRHSMRAWVMSVALFSLGAFCATLVDHWVGNIDRSNLRWLYVVLGVICMGGGLGYQKMLRDRFQIERRAE